MTLADTATPLKAYDRQRHLAWHEQQQPGAAEWPPYPRTNYEAAECTAAYTGWQAALAAGLGKDGDPVPPTSDRLWSPRREERLRARVRKREAVFDHYGRVCACCGSTENLTVDHVNGDGSAHRAKIGHGSARLYRWLVVNGFPDGFQILCAPCNVSKGRRKSCRIDHAKAAA